MNTKDLIEKKRELEKQMADIRKEFEKNGKAIIAEALSPVFEEFPELLAVRWHQYTPYFNDGDSCTFNSYHEDPSVLITGKEEADEDDFDDDNFEECCGECKKYEKPLQKALSAFTADDMEATFGDHREVTVKRDGKVTVENYDHD